MMNCFLDKSVILDIETDGLDKDESSIIKVDAVQINNGKIGDRYTSFVHTGHHIDKHIERLVGIKSADLENAPSISTVLYELSERCKGRSIIGFNLSFIFGFIDKNSPEGVGFGQNRIDLCTLGMGGRHLKKRKLMEILEIENGDVESVARGILRMCKGRNNQNALRIKGNAVRMRCEELSRELCEAVRERREMDLAKIESADALVVENASYLVNRPTITSDVFLLFDKLKKNGKQIIIAF